MGTPHVHADLIKAWADGAEIQFFSDGKWFVSTGASPSWNENMQYRITPEESDVDKYGVEVGDVWKTESGKVICVRFVRKYTVVALDGVDENISSLKTLLFRRSEVDKL